MKVVLNGCYGGFSLSREAIDAIGCNGFDCDCRQNERLIALVEQDSKRASGRHARLYVADVPDKATDYLITDYDGVETLYAVIDGTIYMYDGKAFVDKNGEIAAR